MIFKRTFLALIVLALMPAIAMAQVPVPITPAPGTANIIVDAWYVDANDEVGVVFTLQCTSGTYTPSVAEYGPGESYPGDLGLGASGPGYFAHLFVVSDIPEGVPNKCTVSATGAVGYDSSPNPDGCTFDDVQAGDVVTCINNFIPAPVEVEVTKMWDITNAGAAGDDYSLFAEIIVGCDAEIMNDTWSKKGWSYKKFYLDDSDYTAGEATVTVMVYPDFEGNECFAVEDDVDSAVEVTSDCGSWNNGAMEVGVGEGDSCTITNTLFFEGIPTLNQYGMAIMVLLMLGVGFVGFRRFV
jgi:hypothetical protein